MSITSLLFSQWAAYVAVAVLAYAYIRSRRPKSKHFFEENDIPFKQPTSIFGNYGGLMMRQENINDFILNLYNGFSDSSVFGIFLINRPVLVIKDLRLIKQVLIKDFDHFVDHPYRVKISIEPILYGSLFFLEGEKWRTTRAALSPAFTGTKLRQMFQLIVACSERTVEVLREQATMLDNTGRPWVPELKELFSYFANDVIATAAFGVEVNSVRDHTNSFYVLGKKSLDLTSIKFMLRTTLVAVTQLVSKRFGARGFPADVVEFFDSMVHDTIAARDLHQIERPDMIQLLMQARNGSPDAKAWTRDDITAQCYLFFLAGFETISTALSMVCQELVENPSVQERLRDEIDAVRRQLNGAIISYDDLSKLKYMDMVISETHRKHPTPQLDRECRADYTMTMHDGRSIVVPKGTSILIPTIGIHRDPQYYPNPMLFDPERFNEKNRPTIDPMTFMPFGLGPRSCIGIRMAQMELKAFLFLFLSAFTLEQAATTQIPLQYACSGFALKPEKGVNVHLKPRNIT